MHPLKHILLPAALTIVAAACTNRTVPTYPEGSVEIAQSLSNLKVTSFAEDSFGHIWMGTSRGLDRSDIHDCHQFFSTVDSLTIPDNRITALHRDKGGTLWVLTQGGVCTYTDKGTFKRIPFSSPVKNMPVQILESADGTLFFVGADGAYRYDPKGECLRMGVPFGTPGSAPQSALDSQGGLWAVWGFRTVRYDLSDGEPTDSLSTPFMAFHACKRGEDELWISGLGNLARIDTRTRSFVPLPEEVSQRGDLMGEDVDVMYDVDGYTFLFGTIKGGLFAWHSPSGKVLRQGEPDFPFQAPSFRIISVFCDSQHNLWFGSEDRGYAVSYRYKSEFNSDTYLTDFFSGKTVLSVCDDPGNGVLWVSTRKDGLFTYDRTSRTISRVDFEHLIPDTKIGYIQADNVMVDSRGDVWLLVTGKWQIIRARLQGGKLTGAQSFFQFIPVSIAEDSSGNVWIGSISDALLKVPPGGKDPESVPVFGKGGEWKIASALCPLPGDRMVVGYNGGIPLVMDCRTGSAEPLKVSPADSAACIVKPVTPTQFMLDPSGELWMATIGCGLLRYDFTERRLSRVQDTSCEDVMSICSDHQGNLWAGTMDGLDRFDRTVGAVRSYFQADGIGGDQFSGKACSSSSDGTLYFGGNHGITVFNPLDISHKRRIPLVFEDLKVHNSVVAPGDGSPISTLLCFNPDVTIHPQENAFSISFAALDYSDHYRSRYQYMMEGFDKDWVDAGTTNEAYYANLPSGRYTFKVKVTNNNGSIVETENSLKVRVLPPLARSWWAIMLYALAAGVTGYFLFRNWKRYEDAKREGQENLLKERAALEVARAEKSAQERLMAQQMTFFSNVAHEFRTPLTMISGPVKMLSASSSVTGHDRQLLGIVDRNTEWMLQLVNQLLDFSKIENGMLTLSVEKMDVVSPLKGVTDLFRYNAESKEITLSTSSLDDPFTMWVDRDKLTKITMNLLSNAMKFTPRGGRVDVDFDVVTREEASSMFPLTEKDTDSQWALVSVTDTGPGIDDDQMEKIFRRYYQVGNTNTGVYNWGSGIGLFYARGLAELHHGYLKAFHREDGVQGSVFRLCLPVSGTSYSKSEKKEVKPSSQSEAYPLEGKVGTSAILSSDPTPSTGPLVFVVDDDIDIANYLKLMLSQSYRVKTFFDGESALSSALEEAPDLVISDVVMPGGGGYALCRAIKGDERLESIPVILITAKVTVDSQVEGLSMGADAYVTKPFDPVYLIALIGSLLENRQKIRRSLASATTVSEIDKDALSPQDKAFMKDLYALMDKELSNPELDVSTMTERLKISRTKFYYKVKGLTGENPSVFFKRYKLNRAARLLQDGHYNMSEIADMTGFNTLSHFSTSFKKQFGVPPSEWKG